MVAAAVVAGAAVSAAASAASSGAQSSANGKASAASAQAAADARKELNQAKGTARKDLQPYADSGRSALNELNWQMGLPGSSGVGTGGGLMQDYTPEMYNNDPGYTPMVNSLEQLQATPGYQFQLEQGLQGVNNSASAKGSLLSGGQLKAVNDYAQGVASTGYQAAWDRAQQAYNNAFSRNTTQQNNKFQRLQSMANNGQSAATTQGNYTMDAAKAMAGVTQMNGATQGNLALAQGQNQAQMYTNIGNAATSTLGYGATSKANGGGGWFGG